MHRPVRDILARKGNRVFVVAPDATVLQAVERMNEHLIGALVVVDNDKFVGIVTERDILTRLVAKEKNPRETRVADIMTRDVASILPTATVEHAMKMVTENRYRHLPVVLAGKLVGMISAGDLTHFIVHDQQQRIGDLVSYITTG